MSTTLMQDDFPSNPSATQSARAMNQPPPAKRARSGPMADLIFGFVAKAAAIFTLAMLIAILDR
jgi:phosphate transport system permease protein